MLGEEETPLVFTGQGRGSAGEQHHAAAAGPERGGVLALISLDHRDAAGPQVGEVHDRED